MFTEALFAIPKTWKQPKCPPRGTDKGDVAQRHNGYYSAIRNAEIVPYAGAWTDLETAIEIMPYAGTWTDLETAILSEVRHFTSDKDKCMILFIRRI